MITIFLNDLPHIIAEGSSVEDFFSTLSFEKKGIGLALNDVFLKQSDWDKKILKDGDHLVMIRASYGG